MKRKIILNAAARLFAERGFAGTPTILLAQEAGVAEGTIFRHFKTKDDIFCELISNICEHFIARMQSTAANNANATGQETILAVCREFCIFVRRNPMEFCLLFRDAASRYGDGKDPIYLSVRGLYAEIINIMLHTLERGQQDGSVDKNLHLYDTASLLVCHIFGFARGMHFNLLDREQENAGIMVNMLANVAKLLRPEKGE